MTVWCPQGSSARCVLAVSPQRGTALPLPTPGMLCCLPAQLQCMKGCTAAAAPAQQQQQPLVPAGAEGPWAIFAAGAECFQSHPAPCLAPHRHFSMAKVLADNKKLSASQALSRFFLFNLIFNLNFNLLFKPQFHLICKEHLELRCQVGNGGAGSPKGCSGVQGPGAQLHPKCSHCPSSAPFLRAENSFIPAPGCTSL